MNPKKYFKDKVILITGAGSGIGKALSEELSNFLPKKIILSDLNQNSIEEVAKDLNEKNIATELYKVDVSTDSEMVKMFENILKTNNQIDIVFNNAGIAFGGEFHNYTFSDWDKIININLKGVIYGSNLAYKQMIKQNSGHIVNTASLGGLIPEPMASAYATTKHAVVGLSTTLREEGFLYNVKVSVVCPGVINTPIFDKALYVGDVDKEKVKIATLEHGAISPNLCAKKILKQVAKNKAIILVKSFDKIFWKLYRFNPGILSPLNRFIAKYFKENFKK
ncbi:MAG TPA: SDR family oxidoreductase [Spirochaetota bacterium]|nr:SDR family oxidoreductase [Spirochaetota bacterium]